MAESAPAVRELIRSVEQDMRNALTSLWGQSTNLPSMTLLGKGEAAVAQLWRSIRSAPFTFLATLCTVSLTFSLVAVFFLLTSNLSSSIVVSQQSLRIRVFLKDGASESEMKQLQAVLEQQSFTESARFISADAALDEFEVMLGSHSAFADGLSRDNPLPQSIELTLREGTDIRQAAAQIETLDDVDAFSQFVFYPQQSAQRLEELLALFQQGVLFATFGLLAVAALLVGSASKLAIYAHRDEVEILKLMGASVRRIVTPYMLEGVVQGLLGAMVGCGVAYLIYMLCADSVAQSSMLSLLFPSFHYLSVFTVVALLLVAAAVSALASLFSVRGLVREQ
ncbi:MAG: permease-like cell division protein FtsX [Bdellovibrionota bacterium]|nr:MAG: permease-like cell division protein FtsX [Bdellovibrionota bacterium]